MPKPRPLPRDNRPDGLLPVFPRREKVLGDLQDRAGALPLLDVEEDLSQAEEAHGQRHQADPVPQVKRSEGEPVHAVDFVRSRQRPGAAQNRP